MWLQTLVRKSKEIKYKKNNSKSKFLSVSLHVQFRQQQQLQQQPEVAFPQGLILCFLNVGQHSTNRHTQCHHLWQEKKNGCIHRSPFSMARWAELRRVQPRLLAGLHDRCLPWSVSLSHCHQKEFKYGLFRIFGLVGKRHEWAVKHVSPYWINNPMKSDVCQLTDIALSGWRSPVLIHFTPIIVTVKSLHAWEFFDHTCSKAIIRFSQVRFVLSSLSNFFFTLRPNIVKCYKMSVCRKAEGDKAEPPMFNYLSLKNYWSRKQTQTIIKERGSPETK